MRRKLCALVLVLVPMSMPTLASHSSGRTASGTAGTAPFALRAHLVASGTAGTAPFAQHAPRVASGTAGTAPFALHGIRVA